MLIAMAIPIFATDAVTLRDGSRYYGTFVSSTGRMISFHDENGLRRRYRLDQVRSIQFNIDLSARAGDRAGVFADRAGRRYVAPEGRTVPAGTELTVRTNEAIHSDTATSGRIYSATMEYDVIDRYGDVVIPRGSEAQLVVRDISGGGAVGSRELALDLQSVTVDGATYFVSTEDLERSAREGLGPNRRTAEMVGGVAALGTLLGAIAGGGKGAAIGALAGAAAGAGVQVLTRGKTVRVPAETTLTFWLDQPLAFRKRG
jgi:hypothetical protein